MTSSSPHPLEILGLISELKDLASRLPKTVPTGKMTDKLYRTIAYARGEDEWVTFNRRFDILFGEDCRDEAGRLHQIRRGAHGMDLVCEYLSELMTKPSSETRVLDYELMKVKLTRVVEEMRHLWYVSLLSHSILIADLPSLGSAGAQHALCSGSLRAANTKVAK